MKISKEEILMHIQEAERQEFNRIKKLEGAGSRLIKLVETILDLEKEDEKTKKERLIYEDDYQTFVLGLDLINKKDSIIDMLSRLYNKRKIEQCLRRWERINNND